MHHIDIYNCIIKIKKIQPLSNKDAILSSTNIMIYLRPTTHACINNLARVSFIVCVFSVHTYLHHPDIYSCIFSVKYGIFCLAFWRVPSKQKEAQFLKVLPHTKNIVHMYQQPRVFLARLFSLECLSSYVPLHHADTNNYVLEINITFSVGFVVRFYHPCL